MALPARDLKPYKNQLIKIIHVAKRSLALDDAGYRTMLEAQTGKTSCSDMSMSQLEKIVEHLRSRGFEASPTASAKKPVKRADDPQSKLIRHLWLKLHGMGAVKDSSEAALAAFAKRQTNVERLEWMNGYQAGLVIESLKKWVKRLEDTP